MRWFINLSTRIKLTVAFGVMWFLLAIVIVAAYLNIAGITQSEQYLHESNHHISLGFSEIRSNMNYNRGQILEMLLTTERTNQLSCKKNIEERGKQIDDAAEALVVLGKGSPVADRISELQGLLVTYRQEREKVVDLILRGDILEAQTLAVGVQDENFEKIRDLVVESGRKAQEEADRQLANDQRTAEWSIRLFFFVGIIALLAGSAMVIFLHFTIARPLAAISNIAVRVAAGDLTANVPVDARADEVGVMTQAFRQMVDNLRSSVAGITEGVALLGASASEILASTTQVATGTAETATAISETTTTVEEVRQASKLSSEKARGVSDTAQRTVQVSQSGQKAVEEARAGMTHIREQMDSIAQTIIRLSEQSQSIGGIIASVTDLADQSNLLAVNAAIEAARAGEQGKGFAVVAQEIKSLAEQSKQATTRIRNILNDVQKATAAAVMATEQGSKAVESGVKQSAQAGEAIRVLAESSEEAAQSAKQILASSQQQAVGMDQIGLAMENVNQAGTQTAESMRQAEIAAQNLHDLGQQLQELVQQFKT